MTVLHYILVSEGPVREDTTSFCEGCSLNCDGVMVGNTGTAANLYQTWRVSVVGEGVAGKFGLAGGNQLIGFMEARRY